MSKSKHIERAVIPSHLADSSKCLAPASMLALLQEMSFNGAEELGIGDTFMSARGLAWVLCRARFKVRRAPAMFEEVIMETWHKGISGPYFVRNLRILDKDGTELIKATSSCVMLHLESRTMCRMDHIPDFNGIEPQCEECTFDDQADKIKVPEGRVSPMETGHIIRYTDTDFVGHTNNTNYLKWAMDCEAVNGGILHPGDFTVNFLHETSAGDMITFRRTFSEGVSYLTGKVGGRTVMTAKLEA